MRLGYLVTAYDCPNHFARLIRALVVSGGARVFVHVDAKSDQAPFRAGVASERVRFTETRRPVYWGEFSMVQAVLGLMSEALAHDEALDYLCMVSGTDYPIRGAEYIERFFEQHCGTEFINLVEMPNDALGKPLERLNRYQLQSTDHGLWATLARRGQEREGKFFHRDHRKYLNGLEPYAGSPWWALSRQACEYVLRFVDSHSGLVKFFRNTCIPEESLIHTILGSSPFAARATRNLTYTDWSRDPDSPHPSIIDEQHLPFLTRLPVLAANGKGELLFARKFPDDSESLTNRLARD